MSQRSCYIGGIDTFEELPPALQYTIKNARAKFSNAVICDFGVAEEVICLVHFINSKAVIIVGECLRPTLFTYMGPGEEASDAFLMVVDDHRQI